MLRSGGLDVVYWSCPSLGAEVLNVGGWLTHGDSAVETDCDFLVIN